MYVVFVCHFFFEICFLIFFLIEDVLFAMHWTFGIKTVPLFSARKPHEVCVGF